MSELIPKSNPFKIAVSRDVDIFGLQSGNGPPLLLLHGFPQTHHIWHHIAPQLALKFTVILMDLRGYGKSSKPPSTASDSHQPYAKSTMAADCVAVMSSLGYSRFSIVGHDRGGRVAHKLCVDFPDRVEKVMFLDIAPTLAMYKQTTRAFATAYWHWFFLIQPAPFPENLILKCPEEFLGKFFGFGEKGYAANEKGFDERAMGIYEAQLRDEAGVHAMCEDYRAAATVDLVEARVDKDNGKKIKCEVRVLWGSVGVVGRDFDVLKEWKSVTEGEVTGEPIKSGHYIPEEAPDELCTHITNFFS